MDFKFCLGCVGRQVGDTMCTLCANNMSIINELTLEVNTLRADVASESSEVHRLRAKVKSLLRFKRFFRIIKGLVRS